MDNCVLGVPTGLAIDGRRLQFTKFIDKSVHTLVDSSNDAITGFRHGLKERVEKGVKIFRFSAMIEPTIADLTFLWPRMGFSNGGSGEIWTIQEDIDECDVLVEYVTRVRRYEHSFCDYAIFRDQKGGVPLRLELGFVAISDPVTDPTEDKDYDLSDYSSTFPTFSSPLGPGFIFPQTTITLRGSARGFDRYALMLNNNLVLRHQNGQNADSVCVGASEINLATSVPYIEDNVDLYDEPAENAAGEAGSLVYTRTGVCTTTFSFNTLEEIAKPPSITAKSEPVNLPLFYRVLRSVSAAALSVNHNLA